MRNVNLILESIVDDTQLQMLEENSATGGGAYSDLQILQTKKLVQEATSNLREVLNSGGMREIQESVAAGVQPALILAQRLVQEDEYAEMLGADDEMSPEEIAAYGAGGTALAGGAALAGRAYMGTRGGPANAPDLSRTDAIKNRLKLMGDYAKQDLKGIANAPINLAKRGYNSVVNADYRGMANNITGAGGPVGGMTPVGGGQVPLSARPQS